MRKSIRLMAKSLIAPVLFSLFALAISAFSYGYEGVFVWVLGPISALFISSFVRGYSKKYLERYILVGRYLKWIFVVVLTRTFFVDLHFSLLEISLVGGGIVWLIVAIDFLFFEKVRRKSIPRYILDQEKKRLKTIRSRYRRGIRY